MPHDVLVVGAGTAGCVVAARLSKDPDCQVLLLEAGPDYRRPADLPPDIADATLPTVGHDWGFVSEPAGLGRAVPLPRGRLVGGCGATNAAFLVRGWPADYDRWAADGCPGWSFAELLPTFRAIEADTDFHDEWHGTTGPVPVCRPAPGEVTPLHRAFQTACQTLGHPAVADHNRPGAVGVGLVPRNVRGGVRMSTALTHLGPARARPNLSVRSGALVDRVELEGRRATGVRLVTGEILPAGHVVLAAGAYASPAILLRSGVGPTGSLHAVGVPQRVDLPGVGANLADHPLVAVDLPTPPGFTGPRFQVVLTARSSRCGPDKPPDLHVFPAGPFDDPASPTGGVFGLVTGLLAPRARGRVELRSADPADPPRIHTPLLGHDEDVARMVEATVLARRLSRTPPLRELVTGPELAPGPAVSDDDLAGLAASLRERVGTYHHPVGTCRMGSDPAGGAVVDPTGRLHLLDRLWVADASVIPQVPAAGTNLTTIAVATRIAGNVATSTDGA